MDWKELIVPCFSVLLTALGSLVAYLKGRQAKKANTNLSQVEQENILKRYMVAECIKAQAAIKFLRRDIPKEEVAKYKHNLVMEKVTMYAKGCNYSWYKEEEWSQKLTDYIAETKSVQN